MLGSSLTIDAAGNFYLINEGGSSLEEYTPATGIVTIVAGTGISGYNNSPYGNDGPFPAAQTDLNQAGGVAVDQNGNIYIAATPNNLIRRIVNPASTPVGSQVTVAPADVTTGTSPVTVTFSNVTQTGLTSLITSTTGPASPAGFQLGTGGVYYEIFTTPVYTPPVTVCISFVAGSFPAGSPQLFHYTSGNWVNVTNPGYPTSTMVCGTVSSFSPFALFEPNYSAVQVSTTASGLLYSRVSKTFSGTVIIRNTSEGTLNGPFQVVLTGLPSGVTLLNAAGTFDGSPYITVSSTGLAAGQSATVSVRFMTKITFTPVVYSGSL